MICSKHIYSVYDVDSEAIRPDAMNSWVHWIGIGQNPIELGVKSVPTLSFVEMVEMAKRCTALSHT